MYINRSLQVFIFEHYGKVGDSISNVSFKPLHGHVPPVACTDVETPLRIASLAPVTAHELVLERSCAIEALAAATPRAVAATAAAAAAASPYTRHAHHALPEAQAEALVALRGRL